MQRIKPQGKWQLLARVKPSAGMLGALCDENYRLLMRLAPLLLTMQGEYLSRIQGNPPLHLMVSKTGPFTREVRLNYLFHTTQQEQPLLDPDVLLRLYADTGQVEVIEIKRQQCLPVEGLYQSPGLQQKWKANLFVGRWLEYCLGRSYFFCDRRNLAERQR